MRKTLKISRGALLTAALVVFLPSMAAAAGFQVYVTNERSGDVTVIDGTSFKVVETIPVGKRPRGIHASPDGKTVYVALSGTPIEARPSWTPRAIPFSSATRTTTMTMSRTTSPPTALAWWTLRRAS